MTTAWIVAGSFLFFFILETLLPNRRRLEPRRIRFPYHICLFLFNLLFFYIIKNKLNWNLFREGSATPVRFLAEFLALDFIVYLSHRIHHAIPLLWKIHSFHHSDLEIDVSTALRAHPLQYLSMGTFESALIFLIGPSLLTYTVFTTSLHMALHFHHASFRLPAAWERKLSFFLITPEFHLGHHLTHPKSRTSNFGSIFSFWDKLFRTRWTEYPPAPQIGLPMSPSG